MTLSGRIMTYFTERPLPDAVFQISPGHLSGLRVSRSDGAVKGGFVQPFRASPVVPSFDRPNIVDGATLAEAVAEGQRNLRLPSGSAALLIPEPSVRIFVMSVDGFPASGKERDAFLRWRIAKQMPLIPEDARIDYAASPGKGARRIIAVMARQSVVREYEAVFEAAGLKPVLVTAPSLALLNLAPRDGKGKGLLLNIEDETMTLLALSGPGWSLYRQKDIGRHAGEADERGETIVREAENTLRFLEDRDQTGVDTLWLRCAALEEFGSVAAALRQRLPVTVEPLDYPAPEAWTDAHKALLAPLIGQIL